MWRCKKCNNEIIFNKYLLIRIDGLLNKQGEPVSQVGNPAEDWKDVYGCTGCEEEVYNVKDLTKIAYWDGVDDIEEDTDFFDFWGGEE